MSNICYMESLAIDGASVVEGALHNYHGIFTSTSKNSRNFSLSPETMRDIVSQANDGVEVRKSHSMFTDPIGKFTSAYVYGSKGRGNFFIREGLEGPKSDDVIKMIDSEIMDSMSIGFMHTDETQVMCDTCAALGNKNEEMKAKFGWFSYWFECEEGHILGRKVKINNEEQTATATYKGKVKLYEISVVGTGADPNAEIVKKLQESLQAGELQLGDLPYISECMNVELSNFNRALGLDSPIPINGRDPMSAPSEGLQAVVDELNSTITGLQGQIEELESRPTQEQFDEVSTQLEAKEAELALKEQELEASKGEYEKLAKDGKDARALQKARGHSYLKEYYGDNYQELPEAMTHVRSLDNEEADVKTLTSLADGFRSMVMSKRPAGRRTNLNDVYVPKEVGGTKTFEFNKNANPGVLL